MHLFFNANKKRGLTCQKISKRFVENTGKKKYIGCTVQGSTFWVEKNQTARIKGIVSSSGYRSFRLDGVCRVFRILINTVNNVHGF